MKCPQCGSALHIYIFDNRDDDILVCRIICRKHGELFYIAIIEGEQVIF